MKKQKCLDDTDLINQESAIIEYETKNDDSKIFKNKLNILDLNMAYEEREVYLHMHDQDDFLSNGFSTVSSSSLL